MGRPMGYKETWCMRRPQFDQFRNVCVLAMFLYDMKELATDVRIKNIIQPSLYIEL